MTDKEILDKVYQMLTDQKWQDRTIDNIFDRWHDIKDFIEREWQHRDEEELRQQYNRNRPAEEHIHYPETVPSFSKSWYTDVKDMERHRGLEIGPRWNSKRT